MVGKIYVDAVTFCRNCTEFAIATGVGREMATIRSTSARHMGRFFHKKGDQCLNANLLNEENLSSAPYVACPLIFHSINLPSCFKQRCQNLIHLSIQTTIAAMNTAHG